VPMKPHKDENQSAFMGRCVPDMMASGDRDNKQAVAICMDIWKNKDRAADAEIVRRETTAQVGPNFEYVLSDDTLDRFGTVLDPKGWDLSEFRSNPIALFNHDKHFPVGTWENVRVAGGKLIGRLKLARRGTSARIDELISLVEQGILKATSVGFRVLESEPRTGGRGVLFKRMELLESSLVSVPANPNAVQIARDLNISTDTIDMVFGKSASKDHVTRDMRNGKAADHRPVFDRARTMNIPISKRVEDAQTKIVALRDQLTDYSANLNEEPSEEERAGLDDLNDRIAEAEKSLAAWQKTEQALISRTAQTAAERPGASPERPFAVPAVKVKPEQLVERALVAMLVSHATRGSKSPERVLTERYGDDGKIGDEQRIMFDVVTRAATAPATTSTSGWASQLVTTAFAAFQELLMPASVYPGLSARGLRLNFGRNGVISIPTRAATPTIAGSFVLEGSPIPVRQGAFSAQTLTPKKMAVITAFTREISEYSNPAIEGLLRNAIQEDTSVALDTVLLDATAASTTRPAGLRNGVTVTTATAGGGFAALVGDLKALVGALITASSGNLRKPTWIMNPVQALSIATTQNAGGDFPFAAEINNNRFQGYPVILSSTVTAGMVILLDADDFVSVEGDAPRFDVSDQATLHLEDTTPLAIGTAGSPNTVAAPVRSLFQTDSMALRMIMPMNWTLRRTGTVAWTTSVTW
jgi:HK97 family phage major capsid protein/HK97 family phage prohead protease